MELAKEKISKSRILDFGYSPKHKKVAILLESGISIYDVGNLKVWRVFDLKLTIIDIRCRTRN